MSFGGSLARSCGTCYPPQSSLNVMFLSPRSRCPSHSHDIMSMLDTSGHPRQTPGADPHVALNQRIAVSSITHRMESSWHNPVWWFTWTPKLEDSCRCKVPTNLRTH